MEEVDTSHSSKSLTHNFLDLLNFSMFFSSEPYLRVIEKTICFENVRRSRKPLRIEATNWDMPDQFRLTPVPKWCT